MVSSFTVEVIPAVVEASFVVEATVVSTLGHSPQVFSQCAFIFGLSHLCIFDWHHSSPFASIHWKKIRWLTHCSIQWLQYTSLTGSGVVSPDGVVVSSSAVVVSLNEGVVVLSAAIVVVATVVSTWHTPQVFSQCAIIFCLSHLSIFDWHHSSPFASTHWKKN